ncbi:MAG: hypothetical protein CSA11_06670 [Chloroflexi bacterium]|nr:MAG: hypothetical protein CSA11_06670 [Chloroflexota bacterium]
MIQNDADVLREKILELEQEMMDFRTTMTKILSGLYETVHDLERWQRWNATQEPKALELLKLLRDCIVNHFNQSEFNELCFDLGINVDNLDGETLSDHARELVLLLNRLGRCPELVLYCREKRPNVAIPWKRDRRGR